MFAVILKVISLGEHRSVNTSLDMVILIKTPLPRTSSIGMGPPLAAAVAGADVAVTTITCAVGGTSVGGTSVGASVGASVGTSVGGRVGTCVGKGMAVGATASVGWLTGTNTVAIIGVNSTA